MFKQKFNNGGLILKRNICITIILAITLLTSCTGTVENNIITNENDVEIEVQDNEKIEEAEAGTELDQLEVNANEKAIYIEEIINEDDGIVEKLMSFGFNEDEANKHKQTLLKCGITSIEGFEPTSNNATIDNLISYRDVMDKDRILVCTFDNREILYIGLNGADVYDKDLGGFLIDVNDVHVPETYVENSIGFKLRDLAEKELDKYFTNLPYYDGWRYGRSDENYMLQREAYAKNDLGMKKWIYCNVWFVEINGEFEITGISVDGVQYELK